MELFEAISSRTSYRGAYKDIPVTREHLRKIMEAGLAAPSGCNCQTVSLAAADDPVVLDKIKGCFKRKICLTAPAMILVLTQAVPSYHGNCYNVQDYSAAIENMLLAIKALGYESCWYEGYMTDETGCGAEIARTLGIDGKYSLVCILPVGIAADPLRHVDKKPFEERAWFL